MLGYDLRTYLDQVVQSDLEKFSGFITWTENDKNRFRILLDELKNPSDANQTEKEKGNHLEKVVEFIIKKTYFFKIYKNVRTKTNEIDEVIILSDRGKQALKSFGLERTLIPVDTDLILGECKNYKTGLSVTYVGKFYSLLSATDISFGLLFTRKGLTGSPDGFTDAYGLTKVLRMVEKA